MSATALATYARFFETLTQESLPQLTALVTADVRFRDPFNDVSGVEAMRRVFEKMFEDVNRPRFAVVHVVAGERIGYIAWRFTGEVRRRTLTISGVSEIGLAADGRVCAHIDYWDAATQVYERLPGLGWLLCRLRRKLAVSVPAQR